MSLGSPLFVEDKAQLLHYVSYLVDQCRYVAANSHAMSYLFAQVNRFLNKAVANSPIQLCNFDETEFSLGKKLVGM